ncbi:MAG: CPBP family intramembrane metalloprotease [Aestuariivirga sp.]|nr:CPBP family intramembrane metalloprotease [Aestuariivirga sp.]
MENPRKAFTFYAITLALAVAVAFTLPFPGEVNLVATMMTPAIATLIMLAWIAPEGGLRKVLSLLGLDRAGFRGWPLAIAGPAVVHLAGLFILTVAGLAVFAAPQLSGSVGFAIFKISTGLAIGTLFALGEEIGWRGYMLPRLLGRGVVPAMLLVGFLHGVWHLPLMLATDLYHNSGNPLLVVPLFLVTLTLAGVFFGFLRLWTGSVWAVAIAHAAANTAWELMTEMTETKSALVLEYVGGESGVIMIASLMLFSFFIVHHMKSGKFKSAVDSP